MKKPLCPLCGLGALRGGRRDDEIIQSIEAGNIGLSLPSTKYVIFGGSNKGLFGIKTNLQVGDFYFTGIASLEKGEQQKLTISGSAAESKSTVRDYEYIKYLTDAEVVQAQPAPTAVEAGQAGC